jgi:NADP-dependent 3-hydroxy acid dehydrogenase YdfG
MEALKRPGAIINLGSASGLYPMYGDPVYTGSKGLSFTGLRIFCFILKN